MKRLNLFLVLLGSGLFMGCMTMRLPYDYNREIDFARYKTFNWHSAKSRESTQPVVKNTILDNRFKHVLKEEFLIKGYTFDAKQPDILVAYHVPIREKEKVISPFYGFFILDTAITTIILIASFRTTGTIMWRAMTRPP